MRQSILSVVLFVTFSSVVAADDPALTITVSQKARLGVALPPGKIQARVVVVTTLDAKIWRPLVNEFLKENSLTVLLRQDATELFVTGGNLVTIDDIFVSSIPTFTKVTLTPLKSKMVFEVEGQVPLPALRTLALPDSLLESVGSKIIFLRKEKE